MRICFLILIGWTVVPLCSGCSYNDSYTFANTRKLLSSDAPGITKVGFSPIIAIQETIVSPMTVYLDTANYAADKDHVYLSYIGMQTVAASDMNGVCKGLASLMILPVDTLWFPVAGTMDSIWAINHVDENSRERPEQLEKDGPARDPVADTQDSPHERETLGRGWQAPSRS